jgi:hypothetical protein
VYTIGAIVVLFDPAISFVDILAIRLGEDTVVERKRSSLEVLFDGGEVEGAGVPTSVAIVEDDVVVSDGLRLYGKGERRIWFWKEKGRAGRVSTTEITPRIKDRNLIGSAPGGRVVGMRREVVDMKDVQGEPKDLLEEVLLRDDAIQPCDVQDGRVGDLKDGEERAIFKDGSKRGLWIGGSRHFYEVVYKVERGEGVLVPTTEAMGGDYVIFGDGLYEKVEGFMTGGFTISKRVVGLEP